MKSKDLIKMIDNGVKPIVKFNENIYDIESADSGMMGRVIGYHDFDKWDNDTETVFFQIDMSEFVDYNKSVAKPNWNNIKGESCLIWHDTRYYPKNHIENICEMHIEGDESGEIKNFDMVEDSKFFEEYVSKEMKTDYVKFLEDKLKKVTETDHYSKLRMMGLSSDNCCNVSDYIVNLVKD